MLKIKGDMTEEPTASLLTVWALIMLCTFNKIAAFSVSAGTSQVSSRDHLETPLSISQPADNRNSSEGLQRESSAKQKGVILMEQTLLNTSRAITVVPEKSNSNQSWRPEEGVSRLCAYRVVEGGIGGQLCFRHSLPKYRCQKGQCRMVSFGKLVANILKNGSVLLQWTTENKSTVKRQDTKTNSQNLSRHANGNSTMSRPVVNGQHHRRVGFELSCWWNGSYTQFECTGVQLAHDCRDYLLTELHENIPYRICLLSLSRSTPSLQQSDCVEFTLPPSGMQDIVIAMTTVGGAICVMLVIICLLVAYITENIMSPTSTHTYPYRTHSRH